MNSLIITSLLKKILNLDVLNFIEEGKKIFYDEPNANIIYSQLKLSSLLKKKYIISNLVNNEGAVGISLFNKKDSLIKCLAESVERYSLLSLKQNYLKKIDKKNFVKEGIYSERIKYYTQAIDLENNNKIYLPGQLIYPHFKNKEEKKIFIANSYGVAAGFSLEEALKRAICEYVERDAYFTFLYTDRSIKKLVLHDIDSLKINKILNLFERYKLEINIYDITNDFNIPSFLCLLIDKSNYPVPFLTAGLKTDFNLLNGIIGSIEEAYFTRYKLRRYFLKKYKVLTKEMENMIFWSKYQNFKTNYYKFYNKLISIEEIKLKRLIKKRINFYGFLRKLKEKKIVIYYKDITLNEFKKLGFWVIKLIIPNVLYFFINNKSHKKNLFLRRLEDLGYSLKEEINFKKKLRSFLFDIF